MNSIHEIEEIALSKLKNGVKLIPYMYPGCAFCDSDSVLFDRLQDKASDGLSTYAYAVVRCRSCRKEDWVLIDLAVLAKAALWLAEVDDAKSVRNYFFLRTGRNRK